MDDIQASALPPEVELRFDDAACESIRAAGLSFREVDRAVVHAAGGAFVGERFRAPMRGWLILGRRAREHRIDVVGVVRSEAGRWTGSTRCCRVLDPETCMPRRAFQR